MMILLFLKSFLSSPKVMLYKFAGVEDIGVYCSYVEVFMTCVTLFLSHICNFIVVAFGVVLTLTKNGTVLV